MPYRLTNVADLRSSWTLSNVYIAALEYVGTNYRAIFGILIEIPFALGGVLVAGVSWAGVRVHSSLFFCVFSLCLFLCILCHWFCLSVSAYFSSIEILFGLGGVNWAGVRVRGSLFFCVFLCLFLCTFIMNTMLTQYKTTSQQKLLRYDCITLQ